MSQEIPFERPEPRVVGSASPEEKEKVGKEIVGSFGEAHVADLSREVLEKLSAAEREKTAFEVSAIATANEVSNQVLERFGRKPFNVPDGNFHFVSQGFFREGNPSKENNAATVYPRQGIAVNADNFKNLPVPLVGALFHEVLHLKSPLAIEAKSSKKYDFHRAGMSVFATYRKAEKLGGGVEWFSGLHEAVVAELEREYMGELIQRNSYLEEERKRRETPSYKQQVVEVAKKTKVPIEDIIWMSDDGKDYLRLGYQDQRQVLDYLINTVAEGNPEKFSKESAREIFLKAQFTGNILSVAREVERVFGRESFRILGMMSTEPASARSVLDFLMKRKRTQRSQANSSKEDLKSDE